MTMEMCLLLIVNAWEGKFCLLRYTDIHNFDNEVEVLQSKLFVDAAFMLMTCIFLFKYLLIHTVFQ